MKTHVKTVLIDDPVFRDLADMHAVKADLLRTQKRLLDLLEVDDPEDKSTFFDAAIIAYRRCFTTGTRARLTESDATGMGEINAQAHREISYIASKFVAHSVNPLEQSLYGAAFGDDGSIVVSGIVARTSSLNYERMTLYVDHVSKLLATIVLPKIDELTDAAHQIADSVPVEERANLLPLQVVGVSLNDLNKSRKEKSKQGDVRGHISER